MKPEKIQYTPEVDAIIYSSELSEYETRAHLLVALLDQLSKDGEYPEDTANRIFTDWGISREHTAVKNLINKHIGVAKVNLDLTLDTEHVEEFNKAIKPGSKVTLSCGGFSIRAVLNKPADAPKANDFFDFKCADVSTAHITKEDGKLITSPDCPGVIAMDNLVGEKDIYLSTNMSVFDADWIRFGLSGYFINLMSNLEKLGYDYVRLSPLGRTHPLFQTHEWE